MLRSPLQLNSSSFNVQKIKKRERENLDSFRTSLFIYQNVARPYTGKCCEQMNEMKALYLNLFKVQGVKFGLRYEFGKSSTYRPQIH